ncbi:MAG: amino acid ABC transporter permease [Gammaproteobacteria bacterium]
MAQGFNPDQYEPGTHPDLPPPPNSTGVVGWAKANLFSSPLNIALTLLSLWFLWQILPPSIHWLFSGAVWAAADRKECWALMEAPRDGACWAFIRGSLELFLYGWYPEPERWRVDLTFVLFAAAVFGALRENIPGKKYWLIFAAAFPFIAAWLLFGGFGLEAIPTNKLGGILLTLVVAVTGISFSLPIGVALALGRRSRLPVLRALCVIFIEFIRGVPLITLLFVASTMLTYFLPPGSTFDLLIRVLIMVTLFAAAYIAEVVRGGLQGLSSGQYEAADSLGLTYWQAHRLIILPQALKISIPGIVNTFIGSYKDSVLVLIIGMMDILGLGRARLNDPEWLGLAPELYIFISLFFFVSCFAMSRYSLSLERKLETGHKS